MASLPEDHFRRLLAEPEEPSPRNENETQIPPRQNRQNFLMWLICAASGAVQAALAASVGHGVGLVTGLTAIVTSLPLIARDSPQTIPAGFQQIKAVLRDPKMAKLTVNVCKGTAIFAGILTLVRVFGSDGFAKGPTSLGFPEKCPAGFEIGCTRVARSSPNNAGTMQPLTLQASPSAVRSSINRWISSEPRSSVIAQGEQGVHSKHLSFLFGFPDDLWVQLTPIDGGRKTLVEAQGSLRVGKGDMGVNSARIQRLWKHLQQDV